MTMSWMGEASDFSLDALTARRLLGAAAIIGAIVLASLALPALAHRTLVETFRENGPIEGFQAILYGVAAVCFAVAAVRSGDRLHRLTFAGLALFVACLMLRELDFTHSGLPTLAYLVNGPPLVVVAGLAWLGFAAAAWRGRGGLVATGLAWLRGRGGVPLLAAAVLLLVGSLFDHHAFPLSRTADMVGEEVLELFASALVLLSAVAALHAGAAPRRG